MTAIDSDYSLKISNRFQTLLECEAEIKKNDLLKAVFKNLKEKNA